MYVLIEHDGTDLHTKIAHEITEYASETFAATCEEAVGYVDNITLYNDELSKIAEFTQSPSDRDLHFYLSITDNED